MSATGDRFDLAVVGAGIVGLGHALAAARAGLKVVVLERDLRANRASIRNFGFVTVTGQAPDTVWPLARRAREIWAQVAPLAGIPIEHRGLLLTVRRPESAAVVEAFLRTKMGEGCAFLDRRELAARHPQVTAPDVLGALWSPHELRVDSPLALPALAGWMQETLGVDIRFGHSVTAIEEAGVVTSRGSIGAERVVVCPGEDSATLYPDLIESFGLKRCRLTMLRLADPGFRLPAGIMSDLGLTRYLGYAALPEAAALRARLEAEQPEHLANGVHLIAVQNANGSLVVGDSHHYADLPSPFAPAQAETLILDEFAAATGLAPPPVQARWTGVYPVSDTRPVIVEAPAPHVRLVIVAAGVGASTAFAIGEQVIGDLVGHDLAETRA